MSEEQLQSEVKYRLSLYYLEQMLQREYLTKEDYDAVVMKLKEIYKPILAF